MLSHGPGLGDMARIKLTSLADVNREVFQKLVKEAVELNQTKGDPTKGK